ncbi:DUF883 domain-containing protein [Caballeronia sp. GACF4]|uniref:DUF883 family protein n=1 Tax=Caballeronia sp. GACF4 TaxID=2921763 RepID=UPI0020285BC4|nr:DUF883 domain-containing protein [Caballeronia sp. GACF4]
MDNANGNKKGVAASGESLPLRQRRVQGALGSALTPGLEQHQGVIPLSPGAPHKPAHAAYPSHPSRHVHGSVLEGGDSPAVLAQPAAVTAQHLGSRFHPQAAKKKFIEHGRRAKDAVAMRYRDVTEGADDYVHYNPWKSIALAAIGGLIVGLLAAR